jgi:hypothetical protein
VLPEAVTYYFRRSLKHRIAKEKLDAGERGIAKPGRSFILRQPQIERDAARKKR